MTKFVLTPNPTFKHPVQIPVPGGKTEAVVFTFKHKKRAEFKSFMESLGPTDEKGRERPVRTDVELVMEIASGWDLKDEFTVENVTDLIDNYMGSGRVILAAYVEELTAATKGN